jgi:hypothetical protein
MEETWAKSISYSAAMEETWAKSISYSAAMEETWDKVSPTQKQWTKHGLKYLLLSSNGGNMG